MGVGYPLDIVVCSALGADKYDCVYPTRTARFGTALVPEGVLKLKHKAIAEDTRPVDPTYDCMVCKNYTRAYIHCLVAKDAMGSLLLSYHNFYYMMKKSRCKVRVLSLVSKPVHSILLDPSSCMTRLGSRRTMETRVSKLESLFADFQKEFKDSRHEFQESRTEFRATHELILQQLQALSTRGSGLVGESSEGTHSDHNFPPGVNPPCGPQFFRQESIPPPRQPFIKIDFPRFGDGDEPLGWIYKVEHYFDFFGVDDYKKVKMASFHLDREPLQWFQWANCIRTYPRWEDFTQALCQEFGPSNFDDSAESLVKLRQTGSLRDYILEFRRPVNHTREVTPSLLRSCFIGGLQSELHHDVKILKPKDFLEGTAYAQQIDAKLSKLKVKSFPRSSGNSSFCPPLQNVVDTVAGNNKLKHENVRRLTPDEVEYCRKHGLCFHCKEKFVRGHTCEKKQLLLIDVQYGSDNEASDTENLEPEITACALFGTPGPKSIKTMKVLGSIRNCPVVILIDSGSSHNFVDSALVKKINGQLNTAHSFSVKIADGGKVNTTGSLGAVSLKIQDYQCTNDLYAMALGGCDVVLGVQWLKTLGPVLWDFDKLYMKFRKGNTTFCLSSPEAPSEHIQDVSIFHMEKLLHQESSMGAFLFQIQQEDMVEHKIVLSVIQSHQLEQHLQDNEGVLKLKHKPITEDTRPVDPTYDCMVCKNYTRAYIHCLVTEDAMGSQLLSYHNFYYMMKVCMQISATNVFER